MKKAIDIEKLLHWAIQDELPKGRPVSSSAWDLVSQYTKLGVRIQTSGWIDPLGFVPGAPHEDALIIAAEIKKLPSDARLDTLDDAQVMLAPWLGIAGDTASSLMSAVFQPQSLVLSRAALGKRPPWKFEQPVPYQTLRPALDSRGAVREYALVEGFDDAGDLVVLKKSRGSARQRGEYDANRSPRSPLRWADPSMLDIGHCRAEYFLWQQSLNTLAQALAGKLSEFEALRPSAPAYPWLVGEMPASRVLQAA